MKELSLLHTLPPPQHSCTIHLLDRNFPEATGMNIDPHLHVIDTGYHAIFSFLKCQLANAALSQAGCALNNGTVTKGYTPTVILHIFRTSVYERDVQCHLAKISILDAGVY